MIRFFRRRRPFPGHPEPVARTGVVVVDGTGHDVGPGLCTAVAAAGLPADVVDPGELDAGADVAVILLPVQSLTGLPLTATDALSVLGRFAADRGAVFRSRLVVVWHLRAASRKKLSAPRVGTTDRVWNASELLLGSSWRRELAHHGGDELEAVRCRSRRVERMVTSPTHHRLGTNLTGDVLRTLRTLDPGLLHAVRVEVREHSDTPAHRWTGAPSVAAAIRARLDDPGPLRAAPPTGPGSGSGSGSGS